jgi:orotate phosphoribosyltransferase
VIAGTATAGIPWASWIADSVGKPMAYIRSEKKEHGAGKQIEGADVSGKKVVVVEDLISTGGSSFNAVQACRDAGATVSAIVAIFTYEFPKAARTFHDGNCKAMALCSFSILVQVAKEMQFLTDQELALVLEWNKDAQNWGPRHGFLNAAPKM